MNGARVDIVVGLVSCNAGETIRHALTAVDEGLTQSFGSAASRIVLADSGSWDDTVARARASLNGREMLEVPSPQTPADRLRMPYHGIPGKARALRGLLTAARSMEARACVVIDAGVRSIAPQWLEWLIGPVLSHGFDLVSPYFERGPHEGALTKGVVYPVFRALYGARLRQPAASEFACSPRLLERMLQEDIWDGEGAQVGIDLWLTTCAATGDFRLAEAALGTRVHHARGEDALDLATTLTQVVGSLFSDLEERVERWQRVRGSVPVHRCGQQPAPPPPPRPGLEVEPLMESFRLGYRELRDLWTHVLPPMTIVQLRRLVELPSPQFRLDDALWARIVYDFALGYRLRVLARDHLLGSLVPLYLGWLASFVLQTRDATGEAADERVDALAAAFEAQKPYLISRWRWPERLRT